MPFLCTISLIALLAFSMPLSAHAQSASDIAAAGQRAQAAAAEAVRKRAAEDEQSREMANQNRYIQSQFGQAPLGQDNAQQTAAIQAELAATPDWTLCPKIHGGKRSKDCSAAPEFPLLQPSR